MQARFGRRLLALVILAAMTLAMSLAAVAQKPLEPIPGSPFTITGMGINSNVVLLSPDERFLFVTNQNSDSVTVMNVAPAGGLTLQGVYPAAWSHYGWYPTGMATNPAGDRLYVVACDYQGYATVSVHSVAPDGTLTLMGDWLLPWPSWAENSIVYVAQPTGDFLYVNNKNTLYENSVTAYKVWPDGTLSWSGDTYTGGYGSGWYFASPQLIQVRRADGIYLAALNQGSGSMRMLRVAEDGTGALTPDSAPTYSPYYPSGCLATDASGTRLFVGTNQGRIVRYAIGDGGALTLDGDVQIDPAYSAANTIAVNSKGDRLAVTPGSGDRLIFVLDADTLRPIIGSPAASDATGGPAGAIFDAAGSRLYVGNWGNNTQVSVFNLNPLEPVPPLAFVLTPTGGSVNRFGVATVTGTLEATCPGEYAVYVEARQRIGRGVVVGSGYTSVKITEYHGKATWSLRVKNDTMALKSGAAEIYAEAGGNDPVTGEWVTGSVTQAVKLGSGR